MALLAQYARAHTKSHRAGAVPPGIDEDLHPDEARSSILFIHSLVLASTRTHSFIRSLVRRLESRRRLDRSLARCIELRGERCTRLYVTGMSDGGGER